MKQKLKMVLPIAAIVALGVLGVIGYSMKDTGEPVRVLFRTKGGPVVFTHKAHAEGYETDCTRCHHGVGAGGGEEQYRCRACHVAGTEYDSICGDRPIHKQCIGANCIDCHRENGMDESDCGFCHR